MVKGYGISPNQEQTNCFCFHAISGISGDKLVYIHTCTPIVYFCESHSANFAYYCRLCLHSTEASSAQLVNRKTFFTTRTVVFALLLLGSVVSLILPNFISPPRHCQCNSVDGRVPLVALACARLFTFLLCVLLLSRHRAIYVSLLPVSCLLNSERSSDAV